MNGDQKDALREHNRRRGNCAKCGGQTVLVDGAELDRTTHFAGIKYKVCNACGYEVPTRAK